MTRFPILSCQLLAYLLICRIFVSALPLPRPEDRTAGGQATSKKAGQSSTTSKSPGTSASKLVQDYTLTEPDQGGKSYSSNEYHKMTKDKLIVKPFKHNPLTSQSAESRTARRTKYFVNRVIDNGEYNRRVEQSAVGAQALQDITRGNVVRHTGEKKTMLLHHKTMDPNDARAMYDKNAVIDLSHGHENNVNHFKYGATGPLKEHLATGKDVPQLSKEGKADMEGKLMQLKKKAEEHRKLTEAKPKLWHNRLTGEPEEDPRRDAEMKLLNKTLYAKSKTLRRPPSPNQTRFLPPPKIKSRLK